MKTYIKKLSEITVLLLLTCCTLCMNGCIREDETIIGTVEDSPLNETEIIGFVKDYILQQYNDDVEVTILNEYDLKHTTYVAPGIDGPSLFNRKYAKIKNGHEYSLQIVNEKYGISVEGTYTDGFSLTDSETGEVKEQGRKISLDDHYFIMKAETDIDREFNEILGESFSKYHFYRDPTNESHEMGFYNVYLYSRDYDKISGTLCELTETGFEKYPCMYSLRAFIFTDEALYDSIDFDACNNIEIVHLSRGEDENEFPGRLTDSDVSYNPEKLLEHYLQCSLTYIAQCSEIDREFMATRGMSEIESAKEEGRWYNQDITDEQINSFENVIYLFQSVGRNGTFNAGMNHGTTRAYGF